MRLEHSRLREMNRSEVVRTREDSDWMVEQIPANDIEREADVWTAFEVKQALSAMYLGRWRREGDEEIWEEIQKARFAAERLVNAMLRARRVS